MKTLVLVIATAAAALMGGSAANAADTSTRAKAPTDQATIDVARQSTDVSSRRRHYRHYGYRHYRPHYRTYGYAPQPYYGGYSQPYYGNGYGHGGPGVTFSLGGGGYRGW